MAESEEEKVDPPKPDEKPKPDQEDPQRTPGKPDPRSILSEKPFVSPKGGRYKIIVTDEVDPYEEPLDPAQRGPHDGG